MSDTPRTDANLIHGISASEITTANFARTLERELTASNAALTKERDFERKEKECWIFNTKGLQKQANDLGRELTDALSKIEKLKEFCFHKTSCPIRNSANPPCTCGLSTFLNPTGERRKA